MASGNDPAPARGGFELPVLRPAPAAHAQHPPVVFPPKPQVPPQPVARALVLFDVDGTLLDDLGAISEVAADVLSGAFGTPPEEARIHYLATTGMPFEAQLAQLYPSVPAEARAAAARTFHQRKVTEAYRRAKPFPDVPKVLKTLANDGWNLAVTTGGETQMAELLLEREGLRFWFDDVLGSAEGTKREHLAEYRRRSGDAPIFLVGDSRFDMEAAKETPGVVPLGRASRLPGWTLAPKDLRSWGAAWAGLTLSPLPTVLPRLLPRKAPARGRRRSRSARVR